MAAEVNANLIFRGERTETGWTASCDRLRIVAVGDDIPELRSMITEILDDFWRARLREGDVADLLAHFGWSPQEIRALKAQLGEIPPEGDFVSRYVLVLGTPEPS